MLYLRHNITPKRTADPPPSVAQSVTSPKTVSFDATADEEWYPIDRLLRRKRVKNTDYYLVQWQDSKGSQTWEPARNITQFAIDQFHVDKCRKSKGKTRSRDR